MDAGTDKRRLLGRLAVSALRISWAVGAIYVALLAALYFQQEHLIFPGSSSQGKPGAQVTPPRGTELIRLATPSREQVYALFGPALGAEGQVHPNARHQPTVMVFYGNGTYLKEAIPTLQMFREVGFNAIVPEYPGYGMSSGRPGERGCFEAATAAYDYLRARKDVDPDRIVAFGYSLGGAVAIDLAARVPLSGAVLFNTFTSLTEMVRRLYPFAPTFLLRHRFATREKIGRVGCPLFLAHGTADQLIPIEMSRQLATAATSPTIRLEVPGAGHNDLIASADDAFFDRLTAFIRDPHAASQRPTSP